MVHNTIHATYTETYDLNTINNELSLLAIHTPQAPQLKRMFKGFFEQYKKFKILGCNFKMVCASQQALDPTMVGMETGQMDPRDVLNPILFKACTGEGMNVLLDQIYNRSQDATHYVGYGEGSVHQHLNTNSSQINSYYSLLADDSFRREHPQRGITVMGLKPMVHKVVTTQPFKWSGVQGTGSVPDRPMINPSSDGLGAQSASGFGGQSGSINGTEDPVNPSVFVSNGLTEMPWLDTAFSKVCTFKRPDGEGTDIQAKAYLLCQNIPRVYMGCMILPPSQALNLYYRLQVVWHVAFRDFRPAQDLLAIDPDVALYYNADALPQNVQDNNSLGAVTNYWNMYHTPSKLTKDYGSIDTTGVESVEIVNEKVN